MVGISLFDHANLIKAWIQLFVVHQDVDADYLGLGFGELVYHLGHVGARPGPAPDLADALIVDADQHHGLACPGARAQLGAHVVKLEFEALAPLHVKGCQHEERNHRSENDVRN